MKGSKTIHDFFMRQCIHLARKGSGFVSPNPMVGALLVRDGRIVSKGLHRRCGGPHAEVECLSQYRGTYTGTTLYVNLEPCSHFGKTPPCTDLVIDAGIRHVVVGAIDPNPLVAGRGIQRLVEAGVRVTTSVLENECRYLNRHFIYHIRAKKPYVNVKIASTLDGRISSRGRAHGWISSVGSQKVVHQWRMTHDAVLVGAGTIRADNPLLNVRHVRGRSPDVVILDGLLSLKSRQQVFKSNLKRRVFLCCSEQAARKQERTVSSFRRMGIHVVQVAGKGPSLNLESVLSTLYQEDIGSVLVEGGRQVFTQFLNTGLANELNLFVAPSIYGNGGKMVQNFTHRWIPWVDAKVEIQRIEDDLLVSFT